MAPTPITLDDLEGHFNSHTWET